ncbi:MAG: SDR family NAD(P)-dependent oxidoreductase [Steroidobacteraceae bacterium]
MRKRRHPLARAVALNVTAPLLLSAAFTAATVGMRGRSIVHISSGAARRPIAGWSVYCACKAALDQHARVVAADAVPGLRICSLAPGVVDTDMQTEIRSSDPTHFPLHSQFATLHADGALVKATTAAARLLDYVLGADFGTHPVADLRDIV